MTEIQKEGQKSNACLEKFDLLGTLDD